MFDVHGTTVDECHIAEEGSCTASGHAGVGTVWFSGTASGGRADWNLSGHGGGMVNSRANFAYGFSPRTQITWRMDTSINRDPGKGDDSAGGLMFFIPYRNGNPAQDEGWMSGDENKEGDGVLTATLDSRDQPIYGEFQAYTQTVARNFPPPVLEVSSRAMASAGLAVVGAAAFPRRRGAASSQLVGQQYR